MIGLHSAEYVLGKKISNVEQWCKEQEIPFDILFKLKESGARIWWKSEPSQLLVQAHSAGLLALQNSDVGPSEINALIYCHTSQCSVLPLPVSTAGRLANLLSVKNAYVFSLSQQNCVSPIHAIQALDKLFSVNPRWKKALIITSDIILTERLRAIGVSGFHSDGASALLIGRAEECGNRILGVETFNDSKAIEGISSEGMYEQNDRYLWACLQLIRRLLKKTNSKIEELVSLLPQNTSIEAWQKIAMMLGIPGTCLFTENIGRVGHVFGSDGAVNLKDSGAILRQGRHLVFMSGIAGCFGSFLFEVDSLNSKKRVLL